MGTLSPSHWLSRRQSARCITRLLRWQDICTSGRMHSCILGILTAAFKYQKVTGKVTLDELTLKKSSWCTTQQLGNAFRRLLVKVVFPPLVTLKKKGPVKPQGLKLKTKTAVYRRPTLQCQWWTSFCFCVLVTSGIQSIKEGNPAKVIGPLKASCEKPSLLLHNRCSLLLLLHW